MTRKDFFNGCFPSNWVEVDLTNMQEGAEIISMKEEQNTSQRKDVATLLAELEEIKNGFNKLEEKKEVLNNLMRFYRGELASELS